MTTDWEGLLAQMHRSGCSLVVAVTGGGSRAISELLSVPGASRLLLEAVVPYNLDALGDFLGQPPEQACSAQTAIAMATQARARARRLAMQQVSPIGLGATAGLASDRPKRGDHRCHIAVATDEGVEVSSIKLEKGRRDRAAEEDLVAQAILLLLARACGVAEPDLSSILGPGDELAQDSVQSGDQLSDLLAGLLGRLTVLADGQVTADAPVPGGLLPGSFHPLHEAHIALARVAEQYLETAVAFELSVLNVDKPPLAQDELRGRLGQFQWRAAVELTRAPTFRDKAALFPRTTFVVGADTAARIVDPKYYRGSQSEMAAALEEIAGQNCQFLVAGRADNHGHFRTTRDIEVPLEFRQLFRQIPEAQFRVDISSTELR